MISDKKKRLFLITETCPWNAIANLFNTYNPRFCNPLLLHCYRSIYYSVICIPENETADKSTFSIMGKDSIPHYGEEI